VGEGVLMQAGQEELLADAGIAMSNGGLLMAGVPLALIAQEVGTPAFVYNAQAIRRQYRALESAFADVPHRICFAVKANSNLAVLRLMHDLGAGADLVSVGEMHRAVAAGFSPQNLVFSGVGKTEAELEEAVDAGIGQVNVESLEELRLLGAVAARLDRLTRVGIRVNPDVTTDTHPYISTSHGGIKFGVPHDQVRTAAEYVRDHPYLRLSAIAMHLGSQLLDPAPWAEALGKLVPLVQSLRTLGIDTLESLDIGGGLGIRYAEDADPGLDPAALAAVVGPLAARVGLPVTMEPGRFLVGSAGVLLATVLYRKHSGGRDFVIVDAAMNDLLRPSLYRAHHAIAEVSPAGRGPAVVDVVGPICETGDFLALERTLPGVEPGERLAVLCAGAYAFTMSSNYNTRGRAAEVLVDGGRWAVVRPREAAGSLFATEVADPFATLSDNR
jgi:diaminopimelate decarboxylase